MVQIAIAQTDQAAVGATKVATHPRAADVTRSLTGKAHGTTLHLIDKAATMAEDRAGIDSPTTAKPSLTLPAQTVAASNKEPSLRSPRATLQVRSGPRCSPGGRSSAAHDLRRPAGVQVRSGVVDSLVGADHVGGCPDRVRVWWLRVPAVVACSSVTRRIVDFAPMFIGTSRGSVTHRLRPASRAHDIG
jgi:hypothetical protein